MYTIGRSGIAEECYIAERVSLTDLYHAIHVRSCEIPHFEARILWIVEDCTVEGCEALPWILAAPALGYRDVVGVGASGDITLRFG